MNCSLEDLRHHAGHGIGIEAWVAQDALAYRVGRDAAVALLRSLQKEPYEYSDTSMMCGECYTEWPKGGPEEHQGQTADSLRFCRSGPIRAFLATLAPAGEGGV